MDLEMSLKDTAPAEDEDQAVAVNTASVFLSTIFEERDSILLRPIESWTEHGSKRTKVDYQNTKSTCAHPLVMKGSLRRLLASANANQTNLYFGVCPRFKSEGYDLAWQIRTVRVLWSDIDNVTVEEALDRVAKAGLPLPSIVVNSGNGVHLYWLLEEPYLIDDVGDPSRAFTEWSERNGANVSRKFILEGEERLYLDKHRYLSRLSPKALHFQDMLAGIAKAIDGDHTIDLARLLRIPGSLNRKDERSGREPRPTQLVECKPSRRYPISMFESLKVESESAQRQRKVEKMPLPKNRKLSAARADSLADLIASAAIAPTGQRSEADFAVCCLAIRNGASKEDVWIQVKDVGRFAESGERYFDLTWKNAEYEVRSKKLNELERQRELKKSNPISQSVPDADAQTDGATRDDEHADVLEAGDAVIYIDPQSIRVADTMHSVTDHLLRAGDCFARADQLVVVNSEQIHTVLSTAELSGKLNQHVEFYFWDGENGFYKPIPHAYSSTWLNNHKEFSRLPAITSFVRNPVYNTKWELVAPGYDKISGIYYAGPNIQPLASSGKLDVLLDGFCFKTLGDRTNFIGMLVTAVLMPHFIGSKPALLLCANQPGLGKTVLAQIISILRDGCSADTVSYNPNDEEFEKRLGTVVRRGATTIIVDNAKSSGRNPRIESACLERSITDAVLSFRLLGQSSVIRAENSHIFCITANSPEVSRDLVTRSVVVNLYYEGDPAHRKFSIEDPEGFAQEHRCEILAELLWMVENWKRAGQLRAVTHSRFNKRGWGNIVGGILLVAGQLDFLHNATEVAEQLDETKREFAELVAALAAHPQGLWSAAELVTLCEAHSLLKQDLGDGTSRSRSTKMGNLAGRYVNEHFLLDDGRRAVFSARDARKGKNYLVSVTESAEP